MTSSPPAFDVVLVEVATWALVTASAWACLVLAAGLVEALTHGRVRGLARVGCPVAWRPAVLWMVGGAIALGAAAPANAATGPGELPLDDRLPVPSRPLDADPVIDPVIDTASDTAGPTAGSGVVVVRTGDSLWSIAEARQRAGATDGRVLRAVRAWHEVNRTVVGPDPDLIHPGLRLRAPTTGEELP